MEGTDLEAAPRSQFEESVKYYVNGEEEVHEYDKGPDREEFTLSVREILTSAGFTPVEDYELTRDSENHKFESLDDEVPVKFGESFTATHKADTAGIVRMRVDDFEAHVRSLGHTVEATQGEDGNGYVVVRDVGLPTGSLKGRRCDIAIQRSEAVPFVPPAAIHTRPHLVPMVGKPPLKTMKSEIGPDWQYWSRRYDHRPTPKNLWAHVLTVLCDERWPTS